MNNRRYYQIAGMTIQVDADLPITDSTFDPKFKAFRVEAPGLDVISIHHHFTLPELNEEFLGKEIHRKAPWVIYRKRGYWTYLNHAGVLERDKLTRVLVFNDSYTDAQMYHNGDEVFRLGNWYSLAFLPTDQLLLAQALADRQACYLHSGAVVLAGQGLVFVGHSTAGKSTTMQMLKDKADLLCDDRNIVRLWREGFKVHGTWSHGEVPIVSPNSAPLGAILFLEKAPENRLVRLEDQKEIMHLLLAHVVKPFVTADWWGKTLPLLSELSAHVPCYTMRFDKSGEIVNSLQKLCAGTIGDVSSSLAQVEG